LRNFRCYKDETAIDFDDITALVGRNDAGKSSIMDALNIFLNDAAPDKDDASKDGTASNLAIICEFADLPDEIILDDTNPTTLDEEYLLNADGRLEIHKLYSGQLVTPKCTDILAYANHPIAEGISDLLQLTNPNLKKRAQELNIDLSGIDPKVNAQIRRKIRESMPDLSLAEKLIPLNADNAKRVWDRLKTYLPAFALFKSDRASTDQDPEAQDPLKAAVKEAIKEKETELNAIVEHVETEVKKIAESTLRKLSEMDPTLATQLNPQFTRPKWDTLSLLQKD